VYTSGFRKVQDSLFSVKLLNMNSPFTKPLVCLVFLLLFSGFAFSQHLADLEFKTDVARPAYSKNTPRVLFDEAHFNFHTSTGRYKPLADLLINDGYRVVVNRQPFTKKSLESFKLLIIVNALGEDIDEVAAENSAFTDEECSVVRDWVHGGGALLLIAGHRPFGNSAANLAKQFGVEMAGSFTQDDVNCVEKDNPGLIIYSRENQLLADHPITQGREAAEKVSRVIVFSGQSLKGPDESTAFLKLADSATEFPTVSPTPVVKISARGRSQGIALKIGSGRAVVLAEADMLTALLGGPPEKKPIGMNYPGIDNRQLALNIMHWLSGLLK
jgi:hypothetical protein